MHLAQPTTTAALTASAPRRPGHAYAIQDGNQMTAGNLISCPPQDGQATITLMSHSPITTAQKEGILHGVVRSSKTGRKRAFSTSSSHNLHMDVGYQAGGPSALSSEQSLGPARSVPITTPRNYLALSVTIRRQFGALQTINTFFTRSASRRKRQQLVDRTSGQTTYQSRAPRTSAAPGPLRSC